MSKHIVVGAGAVGEAVTRLLLDRGEDVSVISRSGSGPEEVRRIALDAGHTEALVAACAGADAIYNCANPPYHRWPIDWPPIAESLIAAAQSSGAVLATAGNLYPYGPVSAPMVEGLPDAATGTKGEVRAAMTRRAFEEHAAGRIRAVEVRASDYLGGMGVLSTVIVPALRNGRTAFFPADLDAPHSFTFVSDVARLLVTLTGEPDSWGRIWHVPSEPAVPIRELARRAADQMGQPSRLRALPYAALWAAGLVNPFARELRETQYQFRHPFVLDSAAAQQRFGLRPTPIDEAIAADLSRPTGP